MARLDIQCDNCELIITDIIISGHDIGEGGKVEKSCHGCDSKTFHTYWGNGEAPAGLVTPVTSEEMYDKSATIGEFWERKGVNPTDKSYHKASKARIERMRQKAMKNSKGKK